jgi:hypothetical protein
MRAVAVLPIACLLAACGGGLGQVTTVSVPTETAA